jgi:actin-related protein
VYLQIEEFLTQIFYHILQANPKEKSIVILESFYTPRLLTEAIGHCCFKSFGTKYIYFVLSNAAPIYAAGMDSGLVVDIGYQ